jgi:hypothetical protein
MRRVHVRGIQRHPCKGNIKGLGEGLQARYASRDIAAGLSFTLNIHLLLNILQAKIKRAISA